VALSKSYQRGNFRRILGLMTALFLLSSWAIAATAKPAPDTENASAADQWELATAVDDSGHIYVLYPQYHGAPGCLACRVPTMTLVMSRDQGAHWDAPRALTPSGDGQVDPQIVVDASDHRTIYAAWLENENQDVMVVKSSDFGQSWSVALADRGWQNAEHPVLAARGQDVYVGFARAGSLWLASSHDGGISFTTAGVPTRADIIAALPGAAAVDPEGNVYLAWSGYAIKTDAVRLYISRPHERGGRWATTLMDTSRNPVGCSAYHCAWGYLGAQITLAADSAGVLYALWNATPSPNQPERVYFASSTTRGEIWSTKTGLSSAPPGTKHTLPVIAAGSAGVVRVAWMDSRNTPEWNTYFRTSTNGGATWSAERTIPSPTLASLYAPTSRSLPE